MKDQFQKLLLSVVACCLLTGAASGNQVQTLGVEARDLSASELMAAALPAKALQLSRASQTISWPIPADRELETSPPPITSRSRSYSLEFSGEELRQGVPMPTTARGAMALLRPVSGPLKATPIDPAQLVVATADGRRFSAAAALKQLADAETLEKSAGALTSNAAGFVLADEIEQGALVLSTQNAVPGQRYLLGVFEKHSEVELALRTGRAAYLHGDMLEVEAALSAGDRELTLDDVRAVVTSPAGRSWPLELEEAGGAHRGRLRLDALGETSAHGHWQVDVQVTGRAAELPVIRSATIGFACALPTARLIGTAALEEQTAAAAGRRSDLPRLRLGVEVATAGRYQLQGILFGTDAAGQMRPMAVGQSAAWLEGGVGDISLRFDHRPLDPSLGAPFEVRDLILKDQARAAILHRQARALRVSP